MRKIYLMFAAIVIVCGLSAVSFAQTSSYHHRGWYKKNINKRQENQQDRIAQGINSGQLNSREAARLERRETRLNQREARYRSSGDGLSLRERGKLERDLNRESRGIYRQKHDKQTQPN
ncbi:MAG: hypothetical protein ACR2N3_14835 [Pyrinomonadaceae bacterium]